MTKNRDQRIKLFRILAICGFIALTIGTYENFTLGCDFVDSILYPATKYLTPIINGGCAILSLIFLIFPQFFMILIFIMLVQAIYDVLTGFFILGTFIYAFCLIILFSLGYAKTHFMKKAAGATILWFLVLCTLIFSTFNAAHTRPDFTDFLFGLGISIFAAASYACIYQILSDQLSFLIKDITVPDCRPELALPKKGEILDISKLGLTKRQIACIRYTLDSSWNYKKIADVLYTSESTIKKEMQELYRLFGVKNRELLRLFLLQYKIR